MHFGGFGRLRQGLQGGGLPVRPPSAPELGPCRPCLRFTGRDRRVQPAVVRSLFVVVLSPFNVNTPRSKGGLGAAGGCGVSIHLGFILSLSARWSGPSDLCSCKRSSRCFAVIRDQVSGGLQGVSVLSSSVLQSRNAEAGGFVSSSRHITRPASCASRATQWFL